MDLRIVNTCNSDCLYCLEQDLRQDEAFFSFAEISKKLEKEKQREVLCFYGWNPLLHPELLKIIHYGKDLGYKNISLLTNGQWIDTEVITKCKEAWITGFSFYVHSLNDQTHKRVSRSSQNLSNLLEKISLVSQSWLYIRGIIHTHGLNISEIPQIMYVLYKKYGIQDFECINYNPVSRAEQFKDILSYEKKDFIQMYEIVKKIIEKYHLRVQFKWFSDIH